MKKGTVIKIFACLVIFICGMLGGIQIGTLMPFNSLTSCSNISNNSLLAVVTVDSGYLMLYVDGNWFGGFEGNYSVNNTSRVYKLSGKIPVDIVGNGIIWVDNVSKWRK